MADVRPGGRGREQVGMRGRRRAGSVAGKVVSGLVGSGRVWGRLSIKDPGEGCSQQRLLFLMGVMGILGPLLFWVNLV